MSDRMKEYLQSLASFAGFVACVYFSRLGKPLGKATAEELSGMLTVVAFTCLFCMVMSIVGNFRLNVWLRSEDFLKAQEQKNGPEYQTYIKEKSEHRFFFTATVIITLGYIFYVIKIAR